MISRASRSPIAQWWWTVDRTMLSLVVILLLGGLVLSLGSICRRSISSSATPYTFRWRHS